MMMEMVIERPMSAEDVNEMVAKAICEGIEFTRGDFTRIGNKTVAVGEYAIQQNYLRRNGFKEMR